MGKYPKSTIIIAILAIIIITLAGYIIFDKVSEKNRNNLQQANNTTTNNNTIDIANNSNSNQENYSNTSNSSNLTKEKATDNNSNYFIIINGKKFNVGDKVVGLSTVGLSPEARLQNLSIDKNTYVIGSGSIYNSNNNKVLSITPFNPSNDTIIGQDSVIGGITIGSYKYSNISEDILALNIEVAGGIKLGSSYNDVKNVFGEADNTYYAESLGYTSYTYDSSKAFRRYSFTVDADGLVSEISWENLVY